MPPKTWMVRAGKRGALIDRFRTAGRVAIGWAELGSLAAVADRPAMVALVRTRWPDWNVYEVGNNAGQLHRFRSDIQVGDRVISYDPDGRVYHVGTVTGPYAHEPAFDADYPNVRPVTWGGSVPRDVLGVSAKNSLGSVTTVFQVPAETAAEIDTALAGPDAPAAKQAGAAVQDGTDLDAVTVADPTAEAAAEQDLFEDLEAKALEFIKDRLVKLSPRDMELFVAGLLRAMGYKTRVSPVGPDRGRDIFASPDGLGLEDPRIFVEVKHRSGPIGAPSVRSFLGGRRPGDRGLYVSTGGFARDAKYEADRAPIPLSLLDLDDLVALALEHYDGLDVDSKRLLPLKRLYWPAQAPARRRLPLVRLSHTPICLPLSGQPARGRRRSTCGVWEMAVRPDDKAAGGGSHDQQGRDWDKVIAGCETVVAKAKGESLTAVEKDMMAKGVGEAINAYRTSQEDRSAHDRKRLTEVAELIKKLLPRLCEMQGSMALHRVQLAERQGSEDGDSDADDVSAPSRSASYLRAAIEALSDLQAPMAGAIAALAQEPAQKGRKSDHRFLMLVYYMAKTWERLLPGQKAGTSLVRGASNRSGPFVRFMEPVVPLLPGYDTVQFGVKVKDALSELSKLND